ncbi:cytochrome C [Azospirillum sp. ST 5-10]|uniref:cytochrome C n=1 Tax=unclassified Azospirillum TaxID=2630922 RepID=UPI003F49D902
MTHSIDPRALRIVAAAVLLLAGTAAATTVLADEMERVPPVDHAATKKECGECHMAYQPALLPAASWNRIMDGLADHFGEKASLPDAVAAAIRAHLTRNAGRGDGRLLRITEQRWWLHEHDFRADVWSRKEVGSKANCEACHRLANQGDYGH